jgi:hypothetical protein
MESYAHKAAKAVVAGWLRSAAERDGGYDEYTTCLDLCWRVNRGGPNYGVWEEYPIVHGDKDWGRDAHVGILPVWDEHGDADDEFAAAPPTYDQLCARKTPPTCILDLAIQHKGMVIHGIEIVHKNPPSLAKMQFLHTTTLESLLILPAEWVLTQISEPRAVPRHFFRWGAPARASTRRVA